jgi:signal transduction histidine kinase
VAHSMLAVERIPYRRIARGLRLVVLIGIAGWAGLIWLAANLDVPLDGQLATVARALSSALFLTAGGLTLARWHLTREPASARAAVALIVFGVAAPVIAGVIELVRDAAGTGSPLPESRVVLSTAVLAVLIVGRAQFRAAISQLRLAVGLVVACSVLAGGLGRVTTRVDVNVWAAAQFLLAVIWLGLAYSVHRSRLGPSAPWIASSLVLMAGSDAMLGSNDLHPGLAAAASAGLQALAAVVITAASAADLWLAFVRSDEHVESLADDLDDTRRQLDTVEQAQQERLHDARSVVLGVLGASELLRQPGSSVDSDRLHSLMTAELRRLDGVLDPAARECIGDFSLASAVEPVLAVQKLIGAHVHCDLGDLWVQGRIRDTATVFANLLTNCQVHAPGAQIRITATPGGEKVVIWVEDDGPGIEPAELTSVLDRGVRGSSTTAAGSGLGLYSAQTMMRAQGGTLTIQRRAHRGTRVVLTLPVGSTSQPAYAVRVDSRHPDLTVPGVQ